MKKGLCIIFLTVFAAAFFPGCEQIETDKYVDLRYEVEDSYVVEARNPAVIKFRVKSSEPWEIIGDEDWYEITPQNGPSSAIDSVIYTVSVVCKENTSLDDRTDTLFIKSDHWVGKQFVLSQKGIAYIEVPESIELAKLGEQKSFKVKSNQRWSAEVTAGDPWLTIVSGASQGKDYEETELELKVGSTQNKGEMRSGEITVKDRNGVPQVRVVCTQIGVKLIPLTPENKKWFALEANAQKYEIPVEADVQWTAVKVNPKDDWFDIDPSTVSSGSADDKLVISVMEHEGTKVRLGQIRVEAVKAEDAEPVVKTVKFKQINPYYCETYDINQTIKEGASYEKDGMMPGKYLFYVKEGMTSTNAQFDISWQWGPETGNVCRLQYRIVNFVCRGQTSPWNNHINQANKNFHKKVDPKKAFHLGFEYEEFETRVSATGETFTNCIFYVNDEKVLNFKDVKSGLNIGDGFYWSRLKQPGKLSAVASGGEMVFEKYEYYPPLDWGD